MSKSGGFTLKRAVCAAATATLAASGLFVGAAQAADSELFYGDIEQSKRGTLTIHKFESGSLTGAASERSADRADGDGVQGVTFKLYKIGVDLSTPEGWRTINSVTTVPTDACTAQGQANFAAFTAPNLTDGAETLEGTTGVGGTATINDIKVGAYLVCELPANNPINEAGQPVTVLKQAAPFIVTVPRPHKNGQGDHTGWMFDIHAYPKNTVLESPKKATKIVAKGVDVEDGVEYTITAKVPSLLDNQHFKYFSLFDQLPEGIGNAKVAEVTVDGTPVVLGNQYSVDNNTGKNFIAVNFTMAGLTELKTKKNKDVVVKIKATVTAISTDKHSNVGYFAVDTADTPAGSEPPTPVTPQGPGKPPTVTPGNPPLKESNKTATTWGDIKIKKTDSAQPTQGLKDAKFQVFEPADQELCARTAGVNGFGKFGKGDVANAKTGNAITVGTKNEFSTSETGDLTIKGVFVGMADAAPGGEANPPKSLCYILEETESPAGYVLPPVEDRTFAVMVEEGATVDADLTMANTKVSVPALPLTGASGRVLLMIGGLTMVLGSMGVVMLLRKRNAEA